ncbi:MAG TPA: sigma-70 family RNA polymerase sigma factor, partial [Actinomycetota bacterium]|nr:sigma-70 family RNA polymerase sigma factor [Actinomycetota bacterium]
MPAASGRAMMTAPAARSIVQEGVAVSDEVDVYSAPGLPSSPEGGTLTDRYLPLVRKIATRFEGRGEPLEDLVQVGCVGLLKAVEGFDGSRGVAFENYAVVTVIGEIKHHFRQMRWSLQVPRRLQEAGHRIREVRGVLAQDLGR